MIGFISCAHQARPLDTPTQDITFNHTEQMDIPPGQIDDGIILSNPQGENEMALKLAALSSILDIAMVQSWGIVVGSQQPSDIYPTLIETGALGIIFSNRYTGQDMIITNEYSPGDIFLKMPTEDDPIYHFWKYMGERDNFYDPSAVGDGLKIPIKGLPEEKTDGKTIYIDVPVDVADMPLFDLNQSREFCGIPVDDSARARIYSVYRCMAELLMQAAGTLESTPVTLDGYIEILGRKNPVAWTNPYTGDAMMEVEWVQVPTFYYETASPDPLREQNVTLDDPQLSDSELAGNYSFFITPPNPDSGKKEVFVQFYFYMPDHSVAAYIGRAEAK
jgi:hypothetical protein